MQNYNETLRGYNDRLSGILNQVTQIPSSQEKSLEITENGQVEIIPDDGHVLTKVIANVNVASSGGESGENNLVKFFERTATEITPSDLGGVTKIGDYVFYNYTKLESVSLPKNIKNIGSYAFYYCKLLNNVTIPNSVESIGAYGFYGCDRLINITFEEGSQCETIGKSAFYGCTSLTSIEIPNSATSIGESAFYTCSSLASITIPNGVTNISAYTFKGCKALTSITINAETAPTLSNVNAFDNVPTSCIFYVKNLDSYNSTNWVVIRDTYTFIEKE